MERNATAPGMDRFTEFMEHDIRFHELVLEAAGNERLVDFVRQLRHATSALGADKLLTDAVAMQASGAGYRPQSLTDVTEKHRPVLKALQDHDPDAAWKAMHAHIKTTGQILLEQRRPDDEGTYFDPSWARFHPFDYHFD
jgi:DNA-binding GntR family transcriptional regulator